MTKVVKSFIPLTPEKISNFGWKQKQLFSEEIQPGNIRSNRAVDNQRGGSESLPQHRQVLGLVRQPPAVS